MIVEQLLLLTQGRRNWGGQGGRGHPKILGFLYCGHPSGHPKILDRAPALSSSAYEIWLSFSWICHNTQFWSWLLNLHMFLAWFPYYGLFKFQQHLENFEFSRSYCDSVMICFDFITWFCNLLLQKVRQNSKIQNNDRSWTIIFSGTRLEISVKNLLCKIDLNTVLKGIIRRC